MTFLAVTLQGDGDLYRFDDRRAAETHPIVQYGDALFGDEFELLGEYTIDRQINNLAGRTPERYDLLRRVGDKLEALRASNQTWLDIRRELLADGLGRELYDALVEVALVPPDDPETVVSTIVRERNIDYDKRHGRQSTMADTKEKAPKTPKAPKEDKTVAGHALNTKLLFGTGKRKVVKEKKEGDKVVKETVEEEFTYDGAKNNPKTRKAGERFAMYKKNMTIQQALDAGISAGDIKWDLSKGYIVVAAKAA